MFSIISGQIGLQEAISAIILSNACHLASAIVLYKLTRLCSNESPRSKSVAWLAAALHILSPAGLFLSAPYSESFFSFLSFSGTYLYGLSLKMIGSKQRLAGNTLTLLSAIIFCGASTVRSNGLLNGILFLFDFASTLYSILRRERGTGLWSAIRLVVLGMGGLLVGLGVVFPQYLAWQEFCVPDGGRPWCTKLVPSIYTWVQDFYWYIAAALPRFPQPL